MSEEDEKLQKHLIDEMMKVSKTNPDVMIYMGILMKNYEKLEEEIKRLKEDYMILQNASDEVEEEKDKEIERLNNDIKVLLKENENKEKVIKAQDNIIKEVREYINKIPTQPVIRVFKKELLEILDKVGDDKE